MLSFYVSMSLQIATFKHSKETKAFIEERAYEIAQFISPEPIAKDQFKQLLKENAHGQDNV